MTTAPPPKPRVIVEQQPDGTLVCEYYINGARSRDVLNLGFEAFEIKEALRTQAKAIAKQIERELEKKREEEHNRHNRVWQGVARNHGIGFANRTVNGINSLKLNAKVNEKEKPVQITAKQMIDLL